MDTVAQSADGSNTHLAILFQVFMRVVGQSDAGAAIVALLSSTGYDSGGTCIDAYRLAQNCVMT